MPRNHPPQTTAERSKKLRDRRRQAEASLKAVVDQLATANTAINDLTDSINAHVDVLVDAGASGDVRTSAVDLLLGAKTVSGAIRKAMAEGYKP